MITTAPQSSCAPSAWAPAPQPPRFDPAQVWTVVIAALIGVVALVIGLSIGSSGTGSDDDVVRFFESGSGFSISELNRYSEYYGNDTCEWPGNC